MRWLSGGEWLKLFLLSLVVLPSGVVRAEDYVDFVQSGVSHQVYGRIVVEAEDGGLLLEGRDGRLWFIQPDEIEVRRSDDQPVEPVSQEEMSEQLLDTMPDGFRIHTTAHYVICYNTSTVYAEWVGALYERLYRGFFTFWRNRDIDLTEPELPLVVLVFDDRASYNRHVTEELGTDPGTIIGYYHMLSNQVVMFDLTGTQANRTSDRLRNAAEVNRILSQPQAEAMVATIVHEATHQLAFNSGLQTRFADFPFWVSEGLAIYFETPDLRSRTGWQAIGRINRVRLVQLKQYLPQRPADSLITLMSDDTRFRDPELVLDAYAEAWALNYFLLTRQRDQYVEFLRELALKPALVEDGPEKRLEHFRRIFGEDLAEFDAEFIRFVSRLR